MKRRSGATPLGRDHEPRHLKQFLTDWADTQARARPTMYSLTRTRSACTTFPLFWASDIKHGWWENQPIFHNGGESRTGSPLASRSRIPID